MQIIQIIVFVFYAYLIIGLAFGLWFIFKGVDKVDEGMQGAKWNLRLLLLPGSIALWFLMLKKYLKS